VVGAILAGWDDELVRRATGPAEAVTPVLITEITGLADGEVTLDESRRTKQPDWTHDDDWSGSYPADELADHREQPAAE
jgi:hypothetical protein